MPSGPMESGGGRESHCHTATINSLTSYSYPFLLWCGWIGQSGNFGWLVEGKREGRGREGGREGEGGRGGGRDRERTCEGYSNAVPRGM